MSVNRSVFHGSTLAVALCLVAAAALAGPGKSGEKHAKPGHEQAHGDESHLSVMISAGISIGDARALAASYGLTGVKPLPPGIRKNLARGKPLPPGIRKTRMPAAFIDRLPHHDGYEWRRAGADLVLVVSGTLVISDVLEGVFD